MPRTKTSEELAVLRISAENRLAYVRESRPEASELAAKGDYLAANCIMRLIKIAAAEAKVILQEIECQTGTCCHA